MLNKKRGCFPSHLSSSLMTGRYIAHWSVYWANGLGKQQFPSSRWSSAKKASVVIDAPLSKTGSWKVTRRVFSNTGVTLHVSGPPNKLKLGNAHLLKLAKLTRHETAELKGGYRANVHQASFEEVQPKTNSRNSCSLQTYRKYTSRRSPPYPANHCPGQVKFGNDGHQYKSYPNANDVYTWRRLVGPAPAPKKLTSASSPAPRRRRA
jgi:hypothetical protein